MLHDGSMHGLITGYRGAYEHSKSSHKEKCYGTQDKDNDWCWSLGWIRVREGITHWSLSLLREIHEAVYLSRVYCLPSSCYFSPQQPLFVDLDLDRPGGLTGDVEIQRARQIVDVGLAGGIASLTDGIDRTEIA